MKNRMLMLCIVICLLLVSCTSNDGVDNDSTVLNETNIDSTDFPETLQIFDSTDSAESSQQLTGVEDTKQDKGNISDFDMESYEPNSYWATVIYFTTLRMDFEEGDTVAIDELMEYYSNRGIWDSNFQVRQSIKQYEIGDSLDFSIPKEIVHSFLLEHFALKIDTSHSKFTDPSNEDRYLLSADGGGYDDIFMKDVTVDGNRVTGTFMYANLRLDTVYYVREICFEMIGEDDFQYIYAKDLFSLNQ